MIPILSELLGPVINKVLDFIPDPKAKAEATAKAMEAVQEQQNKMADLMAAQNAQQNQINLAEANVTGSDWFKFFVAGWRPGLGWVAVIALALYYWPRFILGMTFWALAAWKAHALVPMPEMPISDVVGLLTPLLGMGTMRTVEKIQNAEGNR